MDESKSQAILNDVKQTFGFVPNVLQELSVSPSALQVYLKGQEILAEGALTALEQQVIQLTVASLNDCQYCQAAHQFLGRQAGVSLQDLQAVRKGEDPENPEAALMCRVTRVLMETRGWVDEEQRKEWEASGISRERLYEIVAYIGLKTITNYVNHMAHTPVDEVFKE